jgi:Membrane proteins related to metalloendopeptidases
MLAQRARRAASVILALFSVASLPAQDPSSLSVSGAAAAPVSPQIGASAAVLAPESLRPGDPLLAWILAPLPVSAGTQGSFGELPAQGTVEAATQPGASASGAAENGASKESLPLATLANLGGKIVGRVRCFDASSLFADSGSDPQKQGSFHEVRVFGVLMGLSRELKPGAYTLSVGAARRQVVIAARDFPLDTVKLNQSNTKLKAEPSPRQVHETKSLSDLLFAVDGAALFADGAPFLFPVAGGVQSSGFGDRRKYLYANGKSETSSHDGIDWAVVTDTEVRACERGKVVMATDRELTGNTLVIEHLPGLYSLYYHLASLAVQEGQMVDRGQVVARSGSTGLSTGPHLHWQVCANGDSVDPLYWLSSPLLDKDAIKAKIIGLIEGR